MDKELLAEHADGLMATTGCPSGEVQTRLRLGQFDEALRSAAEYQEIFGKENYFLELMDHGLDIERRVRDGLVEIGRKLGIPPVVTNDSHYTREADATSHDLLLCIQTGKSLADANRFRFDGSGYYIKSADEMYAIDTSDVWQEGCRNSQLLIAERVDPTGMFEFDNLMPRFPIPEGEIRGGALPRRSVEGHGPPLPGRLRRGPQQAGRVRDRRHLPDGVPVVLPRRRRLHHVGQEPRHRGRPGPRLGGRLDRRVRPGHHRPGPAGRTA